MKNQNLLDLFESRSSLYDTTEWVSDSEIIKAHISLFSPTAFKILDVGTGTAVLGKAMTQQEYEVVGLDVSRSMLDLAAKHVKNLVQGDAIILPFLSSSFDVVILRQILHYLDKKQRIAAVEEAYRVCKDGGQVIVSQITPYTNLDRDYWKKIKKIRQPLRKWFPIAGEIVDLLLIHPILNIVMSRIEHLEAYSNWVARNNPNNEIVSALFQLYLNAPKNYSDMHILSISNNNIMIKEIWSIIAATKLPQITRRRKS